MRLFKSSDGLDMRRKAVEGPPRRAECMGAEGVKHMGACELHLGKRSQSVAGRGGTPRSRNVRKRFKSGL